MRRLLILALIAAVIACALWAFFSPENAWVPVKLIGRIVLPSTVARVCCVRGHLPVTSHKFDSRRHAEYGARELGGYRDDDVYHRNREDLYRGQNWRGQFFQRVREDTDHVQATTFPGGGDQYRLARTGQELDELQSDLSAGRYNERSLDDVIGALDRVVRDNRMAPRDRDVLNGDLNRLRNFRARHDSWGSGSKKLGRPRGFLPPRFTHFMLLMTASGRSRANSCSTLLMSSLHRWQIRSRRGL